MTEKLVSAKEFWNASCAPVVNQLDQGRYRLAGIQNRHDWCRREIIDRWGEPVKLELFDQQSPDTAGPKTTLAMGCRIDEGIPKIGIFVPELQKSFLQMQAKNPENLPRMFEAHMVIGLIHELDHLALGVAGKILSMEEVINGETIVHADTCEYTIRLFAEIYGYPLPNHTKVMYSQWVECYRNRESNHWRNFIAALYRNVKRRQ